MQDVVHFHGTYRYATREDLERAIASARALLGDEDTDIDTDSDAAWMRCFVTRGTVLTVNLTSHVDRFSAAAVFDTLAETAVEGAVEARLGDTHVDLFPSRDGDCSPRTRGDPASHRARRDRALPGIMRLCPRRHTMPEPPPTRPLR